MPALRNALQCLKDGPHLLSPNLVLSLCPLALRSKTCNRDSLDNFSIEVRAHRQKTCYLPQWRESDTNLVVDASKVEGLVFFFTIVRDPTKFALEESIEHFKIFSILE